ncbi:MAG: type IV secretory system conjugative DNA transfer family protein [Synergistaceae bacterium]|nr:type IV secretory system conjugative DNA transfer family protein [Synergistaceae bacterium]
MGTKTKILSDFSFSKDSKKSKRTLFGKIILFVVIFVFGLQLATQYAAYKFGYSKSLGTPICMLLNEKLPVYPFWKIAIWFSQFKKYYGQHETITHIFGMAGYIIALSMLTGAIATRVIFLKDGKSAHESLHGSAHWADMKEIIQAGLLDKVGNENKTGVVVGGWMDGKKLKVLRHNGEEHVLVFAPTRSGKGVGLVLPTLLGEWRESVFVLDIKAENYHLTSGYRKSVLGHEIYRFNPADPRAVSEGTSVAFNPLEEIPLDYRKVEGNNRYERVIQNGKDSETAVIQRIAEILVDPDGKGLSDHWSRTSHALIVGAITHLIYKGYANGYCPSIADIGEELSKPGRSWRETVRLWQTFPHLGYEEDGKTPVPHPLVLHAAQEALQREDKEASSVISTLLSYFSLYRDPVISANTSVSSFKLLDLMNRDRPVDFYFTVKPTDLARLQPFIRIFVTLMINTLANEQAHNEGRAKMIHKHRLLLMLDEFPSVGKLPIFERALAFIGSFGLKAYIIVQDLSQIFAAYGERETITANSNIQIAYSTGNNVTAKLLSEKTGITTVIKESVSESGKRTDVFHNNTSVSMQEIQRPLLTLDEIMRLPGPKRNGSGDIIEAGDMLILKYGFPAIYGKQTLYFLDNTLRERAKLPAPYISDHAVEIKEKYERIITIKNELRIREIEEKDEQLKEVNRLVKRIQELEALFFEAEQNKDTETQKSCRREVREIKDRLKELNESVNAGVHR